MTGGLDEGRRAATAAQEREVLLMHKVRGVALPEIASAVRIPRTEAGTLLASARDRLRAAVEEAR
jgi:DNA-directed RNA polymerase specialized sigma24 family protein